MQLLFFCRSAYGSAPAYGSKDVTRNTGYPALIPHPAMRDSGTGWANFSTGLRPCALQEKKYRALEVISRKARLTAHSASAQEDRIQHFVGRRLQRSRSLGLTVAFKTETFMRGSASGWCLVCLARF